MIRKIVVTSLLVVCALSAAAQRPRTRIEWGVLGGINIPDYTTNMSGTDVKNKLGWQAGITTAVNLGAFAVEPQILYVPRKSDSGLVRTMEILREVEGIGIVEFDVRDIVRHPLVKHIVEAFDKCGTDLSKAEK